ncbi:MFS transporter, partial [Paraburkholderia sediminicola]
ATGVPTLVFFGREPSIREILLVFVITVSILLPITVFMALKSVPDQAADIPQKISLNNAFKSLVSNKPLMQFIASTFLMWLGVYILNASIIFILEKLLNFSGLDFLKMVFLQFLIGTLVTPVIVKLANRFGKHQVLAGAAILTAASCCALSFARPSQPTDVVLFFVAIGFFITPIWVLPTALVADLVDLGALLGGGKKEGLYMALYNLALKLAVAASVGIALPLMSRLGFDPSQALTVSGQHALTLVGLYLPAILLAIGSVLMFRYPLDAKTHAQIVSDLATIRVPTSTDSMVSSE